MPEEGGFRERATVWRRALNVPLSAVWRGKGMAFDPICFLKIGPDGAKCSDRACYPGKRADLPVKTTERGRGREGGRERDTWFCRMRRAQARLDPGKSCVAFPSSLQ